MRLAFITNYYNHHQKYLAHELHSLIGEGYSFIETERISEERLKMGWGNEEKPDYLINNFESEGAKERCQSIVNDADVVILGNGPYSMIEPRLKAGKLTFLYCERIYKSGVPLLKLPIHILKALRKYARYKNFYVLCASAYTALDFSRMFAFIGKTYKWGYFTECKQYSDIDRLINDKASHSLLWVARFISLKHPELAVEVAKRLKADGYDFTLNMIGNGELEASTREMIDQNDLSDYVKVLGAMKPDEVREHMEKSEIFLFTSDRNEGWGAVLNESMNSACAVVADRSIGSVPFLIEEGENGYTYSTNNTDELYAKVKLLLDDDNERRRIAKNAYKQIAEEWNPATAARKLIGICELMLSGSYKPFPYERGVCSKADILKDK